MKTKINKQELIKRFKSSPLQREVKSAIILTRNTKLNGISRRETQDDSAKTLQLKISTNSESPVYEDWFGDKYVETIAEDAYDESLALVKAGQKVIYSFADHQMDSKNVISSTKREGTKLYKDENNDYIMEFKLDESIELHKTIIRLVENDEITSNSFIFLPQEIYIKQSDELRARGIEYEVVQSKGDLLSIDPVIYAFYPQNEVEMKGKTMAKAQVNPAEIAEVEIKDEAEAKEAKETTVEVETKTETKIAEEPAKPEVVETKVKTKTETKESSKDKEPVKHEGKSEEGKEVAEVANEQGYKAMSEAELRANQEKINAELEVRTQAAANNAEQAKRDAIAGAIKKGDNMSVEKEKYQILRTWMRSGNGIKTQEKIDFEELKKEINERNAKTIDAYNISDEELATFGITKRGLTGADAANGALIIPVKTDPEVKGDNAITIPELLGATRIAFSGLEETKVPVHVDSQGVAAAVAEGGDAVDATGNVVKVQLTPTRYPLTTSYNPLLATHAQIVERETNSLMNQIKRAWRADFYTSLLAGVANTLGQNYAGGATSEATLDVAVADFGRATLDSILDERQEEYGILEASKYRFSMSKKAWAIIVAEARADGNGTLIGTNSNLNMPTYRDVPVILTAAPALAIAGAAPAASEKPVVFYEASAVVVYGGLIVVKDSVEQEFKKELNTRLVTGRGMARLADPHYATRVVNIV